MSNLIYGKNSFNEALLGKRIIKAYVLEGSPYLKQLRDKHIPYDICERRYLDKLTKSGNHQGIVAEVKEFRLASVEEMLKEKNGLIVILDGLKDPHNLGAIIRTCDCAGVDGVIYRKNRSVEVNDTVAKVASGALEYVKVAEVVNIASTLEYLKEKGYWVVGSDAGAKDYYDDLSYDMNTVLVIGSEGEGISRLVARECDYMVKLPMFGHINSLNASVAAGILIYGVLRGRKR